MRRTLVFLLLSMTFLFGCSNTEVDDPDSLENPFAESGGIVSSFTVERLDEIVIYGGSNIQLSYIITNGDVPRDYGLVISVGGIIQPFSMNGLPVSILSDFPLAAQESKEITVSFDPVAGEIGEELVATAMVIRNPTFEIDPDYVF